VQAGLAWLASRGHISYRSTGDEGLILSAGGPSDPALATQHERDLLFLLQESAAFRAYCQKAELSTLLNES